MTEDTWSVRESVTEYETGWYDGGYDLIEQPDGSTKRYYWADLPPAVVIVALDGDDVVFVEQFRPTVRETCPELPAGIVEDGEDYEIAGARELQEETGYEAGTVTHLQTVDVATGVLRHERGHVVAEDLTPGEPDLDENEFLSVTRVPRADALDVARADPANDATLEGVLLAASDGYL
ncbi:NUDIX hydrolase [Halanaeroarchaeum sulfurireducens]|uniref:ADP-ribose pyrophosphatase n=1 Tax=Halanaeroarchaeum sulfurireducens TaxID=1604004 RepID=A0A0F7P6X0_9EURY|nr:NUDIX hydrolase [Halanaeroarchaeum sulfurireducens]AKH96926.1 ADP-ribose pyrophosphatase [Halanaeroarchaeum sulfurireducens]ALG81328.1 ADP-ribose pyrophosphatase [Halanaeroarchaeum sulfurireducens]